MSLACDAAGLLGLSEYEMRVYRALVSSAPATAYRLGKRSGVPLSRVYEVADRLVAKGFAVAVGQHPARYAPVDPAIVMARARHRLNNALDALASDLVGAASPAPARPESRPAAGAADWIGWEADKHRRLLQAVHFAPGVRPA